MSDLPRYIADVEEEKPWPEETLSLRDLQCPPISYPDVISATQKDDTMKELSNTIETGFPDTRAELPRQPYWRVREMLSVKNGVVFMGDRIVVP